MPDPTKLAVNGRCPNSTTAGQVLGLLQNQTWLDSTMKTHLHPNHCPDWWRSLDLQPGGDLMISEQVFLHPSSSPLLPVSTETDLRLWTTDSTRFISSLWLTAGHIFYHPTWLDQVWVEPKPNLTQPVNTPISDFNLLLNLLYVDLQVWNCRLSYFKIWMESLAMCQLVLFWALG